MIKESGVPSSKKAIDKHSSSFSESLDFFRLSEEKSSFSRSQEPLFFSRNSVQSSWPRQGVPDKIFVHPTAIVHPSAILEEGVWVGPYAIVGKNVHLHSNVRLMGHCVIGESVEIGGHSIVYSFASVGLPSQKKDGCEEIETGPKVIIGKSTIVREHVTIHQGDVCSTRIGDQCLLMVGSHVAHDCVIGDRVILSNQALLAGHVEVGEDSVIGGMVGIHQFVRIGKGAMVAGASALDRNVIPYGLVGGNRARLKGLNLVKLKRLAISRSEILKLLRCYRRLFSDSKESLLQKCENLMRGNCQPLEIQLMEFILKNLTSKKGLCLPD